MTTTAAEEVREGSSPADPQEPESTAEPRACARESVASPARTALKAVTERARITGAVLAAGALLDKPGTLLHSQPPTFRQAHARHHECAGHFGAPVLRWLRLAWGYFHLLVIMPVLYLVVWVTESPLRFFVTAALVAAIRLWS